MSSKADIIAITNPPFFWETLYKSNTQSERIKTESKAWSWGMVGDQNFVCVLIKIKIFLKLIEELRGLGHPPSQLNIILHEGHHVG